MKENCVDYQSVFLQMKICLQTKYYFLLLLELTDT